MKYSSAYLFGFNESEDRGRVAGNMVIIRLGVTSYSFCFNILTTTDKFIPHCFYFWY